MSASDYSSHITLSTAKNIFSTAPNFVDLSKSLGTSPPLERVTTSLPSRDIYDGPDGHVRRDHHFTSLKADQRKEPAVGTARNSSLSARLSSKHGRSEQDREMGSTKKRANYNLRARNKLVYKDTISDDESTETLEVGEQEDRPSTQVSQQSSPYAQREPALKDMGSRSRIHQSAIQLPSTDPGQERPDSRERQSASETPSQMPSPPLPSLTRLSPQHDRLNQLSAKPSSGICLPSDPNPETQTKTQSKSLPFCPNPQIGYLSKDHAQESSPLNSPPQEYATVETAHPLSQAATSTSQPSSQSRRLYQPPSIVSPSTEAHTPILSPQLFAHEQIEREKTWRIIKENEAPSVPSQAATKLNVKSKVPDADIPSSKPRQKAHMNFFIITRKPRDTSVLWPEGKIQGTSLSDFIAGVAKETQRNGIERVELTLKTATSDTKVPVYKEDEDSWLVAKRNFTERLKEARAKANLTGLGEIAAPDIYVEPFYEQVVDIIEDQEEEFTFF